MDDRWNASARAAGSENERANSRNRVDHLSATAWGVMRPQEVELLTAVGSPTDQRERGLDAVVRPGGKSRPLFSASVIAAPRHAKQRSA